MTIRMSWLAAAAALGGGLAGTPASAQELVFGSWTSPKEYQNVQVMPKIFKEIEAEQLANLIADLLDARGEDKVAARVTAEVKKLCDRFPVYGR